jgi:8-oxo-dGTP pyrophosphatase MutT (NUDIX family)
VGKVGKEIKIDKRDITELLGEKVTICILQLKSPFYDECTIQPVKGFNTLHWNTTELRKRKKKIFSLIDQVKDLREEVNIIVLPEYSIHYEMMNKLLNKAKSKSVILIGTYYDDRETIGHERNKNFRKNIGLVIFPDRNMEDFVKLTKSPHDADFIDVLPKNEKRILRHYWQINGQKLCLQILICHDFLVYSNDNDIIDLEHGGIIIVPACSPNTDAFGDASRMCIRRRGKSNVARNVFFCNAVSLPKQQIKSSTGKSQIFGHYQGDLPTMLDTDVEGGIIASVFCQNMLPKLSSISPNNNIVIENPITFRIEETNGKWKIVETKPRFEAYPMTVAVSIVQKGYFFLMVRRKMPEGGLEWQFPAGIIRPKQDPKKRAVEEVFNETNVKCNVIGKIGERRVHPNTRVKTIYYGCSYLSGEACNKDTGENVEVKWVNAWEVEKLVTSDLYSDIKELLRRIPRDE